MVDSIKSQISIQKYTAEISQMSMHILYKLSYIKRSRSLEVPGTIALFDTDKIQWLRYRLRFKCIALDREKKWTSPIKFKERLKFKERKMTLSPWSGAAGMIIQWHIRFPLLHVALIFISAAFSPRPLGTGMHFQTLLSPLLKVPRMVLLSSLLWWELGTSVPGPGEWLLFWCVTS